MAKFDHGGGCACGLYRVCACDDSRGKNETDKHGKSRTLKPKENKQYVVIKEDHPVSIISHEELLEKSHHLSKCTRYFELGPEVEVQISVSVKSKGAVYRGSNES